MSARLIPADVLRVVDGDTFEARVHVWPGLDVTTKVRLRGIDAAELRARCPEERVKAEAARDALREMLAQGAVAVHRDATLDQYGGRVVAHTTTRARSLTCRLNSWPAVRRAPMRAGIATAGATPNDKGGVSRLAVAQRVTTTSVP